MPYDPFDLPAPPTPLLKRAAFVAARPFLSALLGLKIYRQLYRDAGRMTDAPFVVRALAALRIQPSCAPDDLARIPATGGLIVAANHPHGAVDGLVLASLLHQVRPDVRILTNYLLARIPELRELCFFVDPFGRPSAAARSRTGLRAAHRWLRDGGALIVFPAGEVAHQSRGDATHTDSPWNESVGRLALATEALVVPTFIAGRNSPFFYAAGRVHPALRTPLLARELLNKRGQSIRVSFSRPLAASELVAHSRGSSAATRRIRAAVERLDDVPADIASLPRDRCLVQSQAFDVYCADACQIPAALREIGRLREVTFRAVGEGTGRDLDLDTFDEHYLHLFVWDRVRGRIVGAYRIGRTDHIIGTQGVNGLYTRTLFEYDERLLMRIAPALELGRSFVRAEYQKNYSALLLLWKGVARYVSLHPQYRVLFGPVSISARYSDTSQRLLMAFLEENHRDEQLGELVRATKPPTVPAGRVAGVPGSIEALDRLLARTERDGTGVPVLLRQYLKLNARLIGLNVDPAFGDVLDALMMVDLTAVEPKILRRYFGVAEAAAFLARYAATAA
jgi:putative hemolysin